MDKVEESTTPSQLAGKNTRNKKIDFSKLGEKKSISNSSCHKCKTMIPVNEENFCKGGLIEMSSNSKKPGSSGSAIKKKVVNEPCMLRFCSECLEKHYKESWGAIKKSNKYLYHF